MRQTLTILALLGLASGLGAGVVSGCSYSSFGLGGEPGSPWSDAGGEAAIGEPGNGGVDASSLDGSSLDAGGPPPVKTTVSISPASVQLAPGGTRAFIASVTGTTNAAVTWSVNGADGGGAITQAGVYTAPLAHGAFQITAASVQDPTATGLAAATVPDTVVTVSPGSITLPQGGTQKFTATEQWNVAPGVTWSATGGTITADGTFTAPIAAGTFSVTATSVDEATSTDVAVVTVPPITVALSPVYAALAPRGEQAFDASVAGAVNTAVSWSILEGPDGGAVLEGGVYRAPGQAGIYHFVATSAADGTTQSTAPILVGSVMPQIIELDAGLYGRDAASLQTPVIVPIEYSSNPLATQIGDFTSDLGASDYWSETTSEYGLGPLVATAPIVLTEAAPTTIDDTQIFEWLEAEIKSDSRFGANGFEKLYAIFYPFGTTVTSGSGTSCVSFGAYNEGWIVNGQFYDYAVMPRCGYATDLDDLTAATSHEVVENLVDCQWMDPAHAVWAYAIIGDAYGQAADLCNFVWDANGTFDGTYTVQRTWSNKSARQGHDPCVPLVDGEVYFVTIPIMSDAVTLFGGTDAGPPTPTTGVYIPIGGSKTIDLDLFADGHLGLWTFSADDLGTNTLSFSFDQTQGSSGDVRKMTITVNSSSSAWGGEPFEVVSTQGYASHVYYGFVGN